MPTITLNKKIFEKLVGKSLSVDMLKENIPFLGTNLEGINEDEINVEVFPNRPDLLSEQGFARAFSSFIGVKTGLKKYVVKKSGEKVVIEPSVKKYRPYTACAIVKGLKFDDEKIREIIQIQEKLHITYGRNRKKVAIGVYPYEKIKPPIRFLALEPEKIKFQPLEFPRELTGLQILSQHPAGRDYGHLLESMDKFPLFVDNNNHVLSMPPIINSHTTGKITEQTKDVFVECSGFDFRALKICLNIIVTTLAEMGGEIYSMELDVYGKKETTPYLEPWEMKFDIAYINKRLGLNLKENEVKKLLERMGFGYSNGKALIPAYRADVMHPIDLAEDIAIAYGYENFKEIIPEVATIAEENKFEMFKNKISDVLTGLGLIETATYCIVNKEHQTRFMNFDIAVIELLNSLSTEHNSLRTWMIPSLMEVLKNNKHNEYPQKIFEAGIIFKKNDRTETGTEEAVRLAVLSCHADANFTEIKQILDYLFNALNLKYEIEEVDHSSFIAGRVGRVIVGKEKVAYLGEIHPQVLENWQLEMPVAALELNLTDLHTAMNK